MGKKWDIDAKPSEKLLSMYTMLLFSGKEISLSEFSNELGCSKQTVIRLIDQLEASRFGKLLRNKRGREAIYRLDRPTRLPKLSLNIEGLQQLLLCRDFILHLLPQSIRKIVDTTLQQASAYLPEGGGAPADLLSVGSSLTKGHIDYSPFHETLQVVVTAIRQSKVCTMEYKSSLHGDAKSFYFSPKRLIAYREAIHINGWIVSENGKAKRLYENPTTLALHRLSKVSMTQRGAAHLPDAEEENQGAFGILKDEPFHVAIKFSPEASTYVAEREWSNNQKITVHKDKSITLAMEVNNSAEIISWVLSFADAAELISPQWLRDEIAKHLLTLTSRYTQKDKNK